MGTYIRQKVDPCEGCKAKIQITNARNRPHVPVSDCTRPSEKLFVDLVGPLPVTSSGHYKYLMTAQDGFTRYFTATH